MEEKREFRGVWFPADVWLDKRLNMVEKGILVEIDSLDNEETGCIAGNHYLADFCQCSETKVSLAISKLINLGYIYTQSFNGRTRILKSSLSKNERQPFKKCEADLQNMKAINKDINKDINNKKESKPEASYDDIINQSVTNEDTKAALYEFIKMRKLIKKPMTNRALELLLNKLKKLSNSNHLLAVDILNQSITNNWQDIYPIKEDTLSRKPLLSRNFTEREYSSAQMKDIFNDLHDVDNINF